MTVLDLTAANRLFYGSAEAQQLYYGSALLWTKPAAPVVPISDYYGTGGGQVPMDHKYAEGTASGGNITAVPNLGGAGAVFDLTTVGTAPISGQAVDIDPTDYFSIDSQADLVGTRLFIVADIRSTAANQYFGGQNEANGSGGKTNILLLAGGSPMNVTKNTGTTVAAQVILSPPVSTGIRLYEIEFTGGGNITVWVNGQQRGSVANPHTSLLINRIAAGQSLSAGLNALLYRSLSLIQGGDYAARIDNIRRRLDEQYGLGMYPVAPTLTGGSLTIA